MNAEPSNKQVIATKKCFECGKKMLHIYDNGTYHCGNCLCGGMISAEKARHLMKDEEVKSKVKDDYVFRTFICKKCHAVITELPCRFCAVTDSDGVCHMYKLN